MFYAKSAHQMEPVLAIVADINISPRDIEYTPASLRVSPRCLLGVLIFSGRNSHISWLLAGFLFLLTGGDLFATSIVVRRDSDYLIAVAADSQRDIIMYDDAGRITGREAIRVCKICQLADQGIFVAAGLATIDSCAIAKAIGSAEIVEVYLPTPSLLKLFNI
jgi:hypothetical protein